MRRWKAPDGEDDAPRRQLAGGRREREAAAGGAAMAVTSNPSRTGAAIASA